MLHVRLVEIVAHWNQSAALVLLDILFVVFDSIATHRSQGIVLTIGIMKGIFRAALCMLTICQRKVLGSGAVNGISSIRIQAIGIGTTGIGTTRIGSTG